MGVDYFRTGETVEIVVRDFSGAKIETYSCKIDDKKKYSAILRYLKEKYGFEPEFSGTEFSGQKQDLDWWS